MKKAKAPTKRPANGKAKKPQAEIAKLFGSEFARAVIELEPGLFSGPIESGYGVHLVRLDEVFLSPPPTFDSVRDRIREAWTAERIDDQSERYITELLDRYEVIIEATP